MFYSINKSKNDLAVKIKTSTFAPALREKLHYLQLIHLLFTIEAGFGGKKKF